MKDQPIIFSAPMIRALLGGCKTMTRRMAWREVADFGMRSAAMLDKEGKSWARTPWQRVKPGDRLWVRENLAVMGNWGVWHDASGVPASGQFLDDIDPRGRAILERYAPTEATDSARIPSIHMPRWASRLTLVVTATKIERLQDISESDAQAEGMPMPYIGDGDPPFTEQATTVSRRMQFRNLWKLLHGDASWDDNPEVVAFTFTVNKQNIDTLGKAP